MSKRILLQENKHLAKTIISDLKQFEKPLAEFKRSYEALELKPLTNEIFKSVLNHGTTELINDYVKGLNNQLDNLNITSSLIRENTLANHREAIDQFTEALQQLKRFRFETHSASNRQALTLEFISFDEVFYISDEDKELILERYGRTYIEADEMHIYQTVEKLRDSLNDYLIIIADLGINDINKFTSLSRVLAIDETGKSYLHPDGVKGIATYKKRKAKL